MFDVPAIIIRFDRQKIDSDSYGIACWKLFWNAVDPKQLFGVNLFEGDSPGTLNGTEYVYCLGFQTMIPSMLDTIRAAISSSQALQQILAVPRVVEGERATTLLFSVLPESGMINNGQIEGGAEARNPRAAMNAVRPSA